MKQSDRGPFARIRWFCADGTILPPEPYACRDHGGGRQHGEYSERTTTLRDHGYLIANILAALDPQQVLAGEASHLKWILLERYLFEADDGWILRKARHYRGALQSEGEARAAQSLLLAMLEENRYRGTHFLLLREAARLLPWHAEFGAFDKARTLTSTIAEADPGFTEIRNKIHSFPEPDDIDKVRRYADGVSDPEQRQQLDALVAALEQTFQASEPVPALRQLAAAQPETDTHDKWHNLARDWTAATTSEQRLTVAGSILVSLRESLNTLTNRQRLIALDLSLAAEQAAFSEGIELLSETGTHSRQWYLQRLQDNLDVLYGIGFLTEREWHAQRERLADLDGTPALANYRDSLDYLARITAWTDARFGFFFQNQLRRFAEIEPRIEGFIHDRMRGSPLLLHGHLLTALMTDADQLAGVRHEIFGQTVNLGLRSLNPGMARGTLRSLSDYHQADLSREKPVVLAAETIASLPPVAGILTAREGNVLSHVQLLARNLGIPNIVVSSELLPGIEEYIGERVVLLASPGGVVRLHRDGPRWDPVFPERPDRPVAISADLDKLELGKTDPIALNKLRADDAGRIVGPKAAELGGLKQHFPDRLSPGLAIPFGAFRELLEQPHQAGGPSLFEWMRRNYVRLEGIDNPAIRQQQTSAYLAEVRQRIRNMELGPSFRQQLKSRMQAVFGTDGSYGVFVRSDTNIEDLPGFTGAGLNLTVPNVVGFEQVIDAIKAVWASPFTERAFGWRQALMDQPEHVYVSVLLHQTVPADKSGVMVTADITNNQPGTYSIAVNEGPGGGVEGQTAESLTVDADSGEVRLLATAAEPLKWMLPAAGGMQQVPASGAERVLSKNEIEQLISFGHALSENYPGLLDAEGQPAPADIEFAFADGHLYLIQLRPFLQSSRAQRNSLLAELDRELKDSAGRPVDLTQPINRDKQQDMKMGMQQKPPHEIP
ncbi:MAG: PEP/pyruvate-binding domain-containing protein [Gammaproteobacteria bacterium]|nr:PEP/pyruvate-binding domain-containing protein [Gammaproteobacteria bacterium]